MCAQDTIPSTSTSVAHVQSRDDALQHREEGEIFGTPKRSKLQVNDSNEDSEDKDDYFLLVNFKILKELLMFVVGRCPDCSSGLLVENLLPMRMGFANKLNISCSYCPWKKQCFLSEQCSPSQGRGRKFFEVNIRMVTAFREIGKGHCAMQNFSRCMNMHGIAENAYSNANQELYNANENAGEESKRQAALKVKENANESVQGNVTICQCSIDGSWQKRGHSSLNGVVTAICDGKCIDSHVFSKSCRACQHWQSRKGSPKYESWLVNHDCKINHKKSSRAMEAAGAVEIFHHL